MDFPEGVAAPAAAPRPGSCWGWGLSGREGTGALLTEFLVGLDRQAEALQPSDAHRLGTVGTSRPGVGLVRQVLDAEAALPAGDPPTGPQHNASRRSSGRISTTGADAARDRRRAPHLPQLPVPDLSAAVEGETVGAGSAAWRLENVRRDLADSSLRTTPIDAVAARCRFPAPPSSPAPFAPRTGSPRDPLQALSEREQTRPVPDGLTASLLN